MREAKTDKSTTRKRQGSHFLFLNDQQTDIGLSPQVNGNMHEVKERQQQGKLMLFTHARN